MSNVLRRVVRVGGLMALLALAPFAAHPQSATGCQMTSATDPPRNVLHCAGGLTVEAETNTKFRLVEAGGGAATTTIQASGGAVLVDLARGRRGGLQVQTPHAIASVRGTVYAVDAQPAQTSVFVVAGNVTVARRNGRSPVVLGAGQGVDVAPGRSLDVKTWGAERAAALLGRFGR